MLHSASLHDDYSRIGISIFVNRYSSSVKYLLIIRKIGTRMLKRTEEDFAIMIAFFTKMLTETHILQISKTIEYSKGKQRCNKNSFHLPWQCLKKLPQKTVKSMIFTI